LREALDLYIAGYEPPSSQSSLDVERSVIEGLYRKVYGSLDGLTERLRGAGDPSLSAVLASIKPLEKEAAPSNNGASPPVNPPTPVVLPAIEPGLKISILPVWPVSAIEQESVLLRSSNLSIESEVPPPPQPLFETQTRKRRVTVTDQPDPGAESQAEPQGSTRKRRVAAPARQMRRKR
jgi:hypothetical protein